MIKIIFFLVFLYSSTQAFLQTDYKINPWIKENYLIDAKLMVYENNLNHRDSVYMPKQEIDKFLQIFSAVYEINDSIFKKHDIRATGNRYSWLPLMLDESYKWVKQLYKTKGKSGNKEFDAVIEKYGLYLEVANGYPSADFYSSDIINVWPILLELEKIEGVSMIMYDHLINEKDRIVYDQENETIEFRFFDMKNNPDDWSPENLKILWKYKIINGQAILIHFHNFSLE